MANSGKPHAKTIDDTRDDTRGASAEPGKSPQFEEELADLEQIVEQIDTGELSLEEAIGAFERGVGLVRSLNRKLDEVERRVEVLMRGAEGDLKRSIYPGATDTGENGETTDRPAGQTRGDDDDPPF